MYQKLANKLKNKVPDDEDELPTLIIGNWGAPNARFHAPTPGAKLKRKLVSHGFAVFLINEFRSSSTCPRCLQRSVHPFVDVPNPRPFRREQRPFVECRRYAGVSELIYKLELFLIISSCSCDTPQCEETVMNRDTLACLNFRHSLLSVRENGQMHPVFQRGQQ